MESTTVLGTVHDVDVPSVPDFAVNVALVFVRALKPSSLAALNATLSNERLAPAPLPSPASGNDPWHFDFSLAIPGLFVCSVALVFELTPAGCAGL